MALSPEWQGGAELHSPPCTAPGERGTSFCPTAWEHIPTARHAMAWCKHPCCPMSQDLGTFPLSHIPWLDVPGFS